MKLGIWSRVNANRFLVVLLATITFGLLLTMQAPRVFPQGAMSLFSQALLWGQFCITILVALVFLAVGALVWLYARDRLVALVLFGFCSAMMLTFAALSGNSRDASVLSSLFTLISFISTILSIPLLSALLLLFPKTYFPPGSTSASGQRTAVRLLLFAYLGCLSIVGLLLTFHTLLQFAFPVLVESLENLRGLVNNFYYLTGIVGCLITITVSYKRSSTPRERQQMRLLVGGVALALSPALVLTVLPTALNLPQQDLVDARLSTLSLGLLPLAVGYAILRYQILIFDRYIRRIVASIVGCVGLVLFGFLMIALNSLLSSAHVAFAPVYVTALTTLGALRTWMGAKVVTDRLFFSEILHYRHLIEKPATPLDETLSLNEAARLLTTVAIDTFSTPQVCFFVADKESKSYRACPPINEDDPNDARRALVHHLASLEEPIARTGTWATLHHNVVEDLGAATRPLLLYEVRRASKERPEGLSRYLKGSLPLVGTDVLLAPVRAQGQLIGVLVLGPQGDQQAYAGPDFDIVQLLLARYSSLVETARVMLELRAAYERQKELDRLKDEFVIIASHELRTPLTAVQGYIELLGDFDQELPAETREEFLRKARHSVEELALLVGNIMNVGRIETDAEQVTVGPVPLGEQIVQTVEMFAAVLQRENRQLHVDIPASIHVLADDFCLRQVMRNLIGNALKYSPPGTNVEIGCKQSGEEVAVFVRDYGLGIPPEDQIRLFERFVRLERDMNSPVRGSGLGLYISKQLVEAMGGRIWVESTGIPGRGSQFVCMLPSAPSTTERSERKLATVV